MNWLVRWFLLGSATVCALSPAAHAQTGNPEPIRVESNEVLVPVVVWDPRRLGEITPSDLVQATINKDFRIPHLGHVSDLAASEFQISEDGHEQKIHSVTLERPRLVDVRDNVGRHFEYRGEGGGRWILRDWPQKSESLNVDVIYDVPTYLIAYAPPASPDGSCHRVGVAVSRPFMSVMARDVYCKTMAPISDPLRGTKLGKQMEYDLASANDGKIPVLLMTVPLFTDRGGARIHIALEFSEKKLKDDLKKVGPLVRFRVLGMVYAKDGSIVARFSDSNCCESGYGSGAAYLIVRKVGDPTQPAFLDAPTRYETQVYLPPGEYDLRIVLSDDVNFGRAQSSIKVDGFDVTQLAISEIALAKRFRAAPKMSPGSLPTRPGSYMPLTGEGIEITPTSDSGFKKGKLLYVYFEVYEPQKPDSGSKPLQAHFRVLEANTGKVIKAFQSEIAVPDAKPGNPAIPVAERIDTGKLRTGSYRLEVQATDSTGNSTPLRATNFTIE